VKENKKGGVTYWNFVAIDKEPNNETYYTSINNSSSYVYKTNCCRLWDFNQAHNEMLAKAWGEMKFHKCSDEFNNKTKKKKKTWIQKTRMKLIVTSFSYEFYELIALWFIIMKKTRT
jgi:hypothetical protein